MTGVTCLAGDNPTAKKPPHPVHLVPTISIMVAPCKMTLHEVASIARRVLQGLRQGFPTFRAGRCTAAWTFCTHAAHETLQLDLAILLNVWLAIQT